MLWQDSKGNLAGREPFYRYYMTLYGCEVCPCWKDDCERYVSILENEAKKNGWKILGKGLLFSSIFHKGYIDYDYTYYGTNHPFQKPILSIITVDAGDFYAYVEQRCGKCYVYNFPRELFNKASKEDFLFLRYDYDEMKLDYQDMVLSNPDFFNVVDYTRGSNTKIKWDEPIDDYHHHEYNDYYEVIQPYQGWKYPEVIFTFGIILYDSLICKVKINDEYGWIYIGSNYTIVEREHSGEPCRYSNVLEISKFEKFDFSFAGKIEPFKYDKDLDRYFQGMQQWVENTYKSSVHAYNGQHEYHSQNEIVYSYFSDLYPEDYGRREDAEKYINNVRDTKPMDDKYILWVGNWYDFDEYQTSALVGFSKNFLDNERHMPILTPISPLDHSIVKCSEILLKEGIPTQYGEHDAFYTRTQYYVLNSPIHIYKNPYVSKWSDLNPDLSKYPIDFNDPNIMYYVEFMVTDKGFILKGEKGKKKTIRIKSYKEYFTKEMDDKLIKDDFEHEGEFLTTEEIFHESEYHSKELKVSDFMLLDPYESQEDTDVDLGE